ncbi:hypothetical protein AB1Y20_015365 [Prymnesium parvum]|uniref:Uncharacterized protein n=1 Tax=Prymnesium parvum TaxID=97485 RepID=A0AB34K0M5_PRYPA
MASARQKWMFAAAFIGMWGPLTVFGSHRTLLFVVYYQADVSALAAVGIVMGLIDALNGPLLARFADAGIANRLRCFPVAKWGRRAPLMLIGTPLMLAGPTLMWLAPSRDRTALTVWYTLCYLLMVNGVTVTLQSYLASIQELFPTGPDRARAVVRQTPFLVLTYIIAGALPVTIAFTANPDTEGQCCVTSRFDCSVKPPCGCFVNESTGTDAIDSALQLYEHKFLSVCGNSSALASATLEQVALERSEMCDDPGVPFARFAAVALLTFVMGWTALFAVPPARTIGDTKPPVKSKTSFLASIHTTFAQRPFQVYSANMFLSTTWTSFLLSNVFIYLVYISRMEPAEIGAQYVVLLAVVLVSRISSLPLFTKLLLRFPRYAHPARLLAYLKGMEVVLTPVIFSLLRLPNAPITPLLVGTGAVIGILQSPQDMCNHMLVGWAIDEDASKNAFQRREGMFYACNGVTQHLSQVVVAAVLGFWGMAGFDPSKCADSQPPSAYTAIETTFIVGLPALSALSALVLLAYPIQGERLEKLQKMLEEVAVELEVVSARLTAEDITVFGQPPSVQEMVNEKEVKLPTESETQKSDESLEEMVDASTPGDADEKDVAIQQVKALEEGATKVVDSGKGHRRTQTWAPPSSTPAAAGHTRAPSDTRAVVAAMRRQDADSETKLDRARPGHSRTPSADARAVVAALKAERQALHVTSGVGMSLHARVPSADVGSILAALRAELRSS